MIFVRRGATLVSTPTLQDQIASRSSVCAAVWRRCRALAKDDKRPNYILFALAFVDKKICNFRNSRSIIGSQCRRHSVGVVMLTSKYHLLACIVVATSLSVVERAQSATVITGGTSPIFATAVDNVLIDTVTYDVTFSTAANTTFLGNSAGAIDASRALRDALNGSTATAINAVLAVGFIVEEETNGGEPVVYNSVADVWQAPGGPATVTGGLIADFTATSATPLPGALPLFATVLGGVGVLGWRKKRKNVAAMAAA